MSGKTFNLTEKRVEALRYIAAHPGVYVCGIAENVLSKRPLWAQAATRMGAGYCKVLQEQGLVAINTRVNCGYGTVRITEKGLAKLAETDAKIEAEKNSLDAVLARCVEAA